MPIDSVNRPQIATIQSEPGEVSHQYRSSSEIQEQSLSQSSSQSSRQSSSKRSTHSQQPLRLSAPVSDSGGAPAHGRIIAADLDEISNALAQHLYNICRDVVDRINSRWSSASPDNTHLKKFVNARYTLNMHVITPLSRYPRDNATNRINPNTLLSIEDAAKFSRAFEIAARELPKGEVRELVGLLGQHIKAAWMQMKTDEVKLKAKKEMESFRDPETFQMRSVSVEARFNIGSPQIKLNNIRGVPASAHVRGALELGKRGELMIDPESLAFLNKGTKKSLSFGGGAEADLISAVRVHLDGQIKVEKDDVKMEFFTSIDKMVDNKAYTRQFAKGNRDEYGGALKRGIWNKTKKIIGESIDNKKVLTSYSEISKLKEDQQHAVDNQKRLNELLKIVLKLHNADISASSPDRSSGLKGYTKAVTVSVNGTAGASLAAADVSGDINLFARKSIYDFRLHVPTQFSDIIQEKPERLSELPVKLMRHVYEVLHHTEENSAERRNAAESKLLDLNTDLKKYSEVVKDLDGLRYRQSKKIAGKDKMMEKELAKEKHQIENKWYAIGRHNFLQALSASHALLVLNAMPPGSQPSDETLKAAKDAGEKLKNPDFRYDKGRLDKAGAFNKDLILQYRSSAFSAGANIEAYGQSGSLTYSRVSDNRIHISRVRQGDYITKSWTATGNISANAPINAVAEKLREATSNIERSGGNSEDQTDIRSQLSEILDENSANGEFTHERSRITRDFVPEYRQKPDYDGSNEYQRLFNRITKTSTLGGQLGGTGPASPGVNVGGNVGYEQSRSTMVKQTLGDNNLDFAFSMLNRMDKNNEPELKRQFFETHKVEFGKMFKNLGESGTNIHQEARFFLDELINRAPDTEKNRAGNALSILSSGTKSPSKREAAFSALRALTSTASTAEEKDGALMTLRESLKFIPWNDRKEPTPEKSTVYSLGLGGKKIFNKKIIPGEQPSTKFEKAEKALDTLEKEIGKYTSGSQSRNKTEKKTQEAIKTLNRLFDDLDRVSEYEQAKNTISTLLKKVPPESEEYKNAEACLNNLINPEDVSDSGTYIVDHARIRERSSSVLADFIGNHADTASAKDEALNFKNNFNTAMRDFKHDPSPANYENAKSMFISLQKQQLVPWNEGFWSTLEDVPFKKKDAASALDIGTRILKEMGMHPRAREQNGGGRNQVSIDPTQTSPESTPQPGRSGRS